MKKIFAFALALVAFTGCGNEPKTLTKKEPNAGKPQPVKCPANAIALHELSLYLKNFPPAKLALEIDGKRKIDECQAIKEEDPMVTIERSSGNALEITVNHGAAYPRLPVDISFRLFNLGACGTPEVLVLEKNRLPLEFEVTYPNGTTCPTRTHAKLLVFE